MKYLSYRLDPLWQRNEVNLRYSALDRFYQEDFLDQVGKLQRPPSPLPLNEH